MKTLRNSKCNSSRYAVLDEYNEVAANTDKEVKEEEYETDEIHSNKERTCNMKEVNYNVEDMSVDKIDEYLREVIKKEKDEQDDNSNSSVKDLPAVDDLSM